MPIPRGMTNPATYRAGKLQLPPTTYGLVKGRTQARRPGGRHADTSGATCETGRKNLTGRAGKWTTTKTTSPRVADRTGASLIESKRVPVRKFTDRFGTMMTPDGVKPRQSGAKRFRDRQTRPWAVSPSPNGRPMRAAPIPVPGQWNPPS